VIFIGHPATKLHRHVVADPFTNVATKEVPPPTLCCGAITCTVIAANALQHPDGAYAYEYKRTEERTPQDQSELLLTVQVSIHTHPVGVEEEAVIGIEDNAHCQTRVSKREAR
jgi:hypothetical protein